MKKTLPSLENLAMVSEMLEKELEISTEHMVITIRTSPEEHLIFDENLHNLFGEGVFKHRDVINFKMGNIIYEIISDDTIELDDDIKVDEEGKVYI